jgi:ubiquinone/menaquinone biosynthesis C-methylase UbiE
MKTDRKTWTKKVQNLLKRREKGVADNDHCELLVRDYARHLRAIKIGSSILDVGCGAMTIGDIIAKDYPNVKYLGVDAFPVNDQVIEMKIEDDKQVDNFIKTHGQFDHVTAFAMLDNCQDIVAATNNIKRLANKSVLILTGIDIETDQFHTFKITKENLDALMLADGWKITMSNFLTPNVLLIEYSPV